MTTSIYIIYKITNTLNNKSYIGQTITTLQKRWIKHKSSAKTKKINNHFQNAINKYDESIWDKSVIFTCFDRTYLNEAEERLIEDYNTFYNGYNSTSGGDCPIYTKQTNKSTRIYKSLSKEQKLHLSKINSGINHPMWGKTHNVETKIKYSECKIGTKNPMFKGYYITPFGKLTTQKDILKITNLLSPSTVTRWCKNSDNTIKTQSFYQSDYLKSLGKEIIGKTFRTIGFWFEPK